MSSATKKTCADNGVDVVFEFTDATINVGESNLDDLLADKADKKAIDSKGQIWFTTNSDADPRNTIDSGGIDSRNIWQQIGTIQLTDKTLYIWECTKSASIQA